MNKIEKYTSIYPEETVLNSLDKRLIGLAIQSLYNFIPPRKSNHSSLDLSDPQEKNWYKYATVLGTKTYEVISKIAWSLHYLQLKRLNPDLNSIESLLNSLFSHLNNHPKSSKLERLMELFAIQSLNSNIKALNLGKELEYKFEKILQELNEEFNQFFSDQREFINSLDVADWQLLSSDEYRICYKDIYRYKNLPEAFRDNLIEELKKTKKLHHENPVLSGQRKNIKIEEVGEFLHKVIAYCSVEFPLIKRDFHIEVREVPVNLLSLIPKAYYLHQNKYEPSQKGIFYINTNKELDIGYLLLLIFHEVLGHGLHFHYYLKQKNLENSLYYQGRFLFTEGWALLMEEYLLDHLSDLTGTLGLSDEDCSLIRNNLYWYKIIRIYRAILEIDLYENAVNPSSHQLLQELTLEERDLILEDFIYFANTPLYAMSYMQGYLYFKGNKPTEELLVRDFLDFND